MFETSSGNSLAISHFWLLDDFWFFDWTTFISHWHIIRRWTWLLGAATFPASWLQNKCKSLSKQIQVIIGWMLKLLGRVDLIMQLANHSDFPMTIGKEQLTIRTDFLTWKSLHKCYMVSKCFFSVAEIMFRAQHLGLIPSWCLLPSYCAVLNLLLVVSKSNVRLNRVFLGRIDCKCIQFDIERRVVVVQFSLSKNHLLLFHQSGMKLK